MLKLKLLYSGHLIQTANSMEKTLMLGKMEIKRRKKVADDEMVGWDLRFNGHEVGQTLGDGEEQGSLACCSSWSHKELDMAERLNSLYPLPSWAN